MTKIDKNIANEILEITHGFLKEVDSPWAYRTVTLDASLEQDFGIDSLKRAELIHRIELAFHVKLSYVSISKLNTLQDIITAVQEAKPIQSTPSNKFVPSLKIDKIRSQAFGFVF